MATQDGEDAPDRLGEALARLDPRSRRLAELWLAGLGRREIAAEMKIRDEVVGAIGETAFRRLRLILEGGPWHAAAADGGTGSAMTHPRPPPGCLDEAAD